MPGPAAIDAGLRVAAPSDALCIGVLATQVFLDTYATGGIREAIAREVRESLSTEAVSALLADPDETFVVAEHAGHLVAFAELARGTAQSLVPAEGAVELKRLYVQEGYAGRGVGTALLRHAEALAAKQGAARLWLTAWIGNTRARAFYARRGYRELGSTMVVIQGEQHENRVYSRELRDAGTVVQRQLEAYNARDLEAFLANFSDDVEVFRPPQAEPALAGKEAFAKFYATERFNRPGLHAGIVNRMVMGPIVVDHERISGVREEPFEMAVVFEVADGLIRRMWAYAP